MLLVGRVSDRSLSSIDLITLLDTESQRAARSFFDSGRVFVLDGCPLLPAAVFSSICRTQRG